MKRALCMIRDGLVYRRAGFVAGLTAAGYSVVKDLRDPRPEDVLVIWNRYGQTDAAALRFEKAGAKVVVAENGYLGKEWLDDVWFALALNQHAGAGQWNEGGVERWDSLNVTLHEWKVRGIDTVILAQRGIGSPRVRSPDGWAEETQRRIGGRIRKHPGKNDPEVSMEKDLRNAACVVTWASSAALKALVLGVPVWYEMPDWIGAQASRHLDQWGIAEPNVSHLQRLTMFRRLIWAQWRFSEISDGTAFRHLLTGPV